jgi:twitching motility two-component system response regulator PilH
MDRQRVILVVDDHPSVRKSALRLLVARGYTAIEATNAVEALAKAIEIIPDVILMDLHMQPMNGLDAARQLKAMDGLKNIPIIAMSATPPLQPELQLFARVLLKPCPATDLVDAIESALRQP